MDIVVIGNGGHAKVILDLIEAAGLYRVIGYVDEKYERTSFEQGVFYTSFHSLDLKRLSPECKVIIAIGDNLTRRKIYKKLALSEEKFATLIHPTAVISPRASIGPGSIIMANAVIHADANVGSQTIINTNSVVEHDCQIGDFVHLSPSATLTGNVTIEDDVFIGAGSTVIPSVSVRKGSIIGAGSIVIKDVPPNRKAVGNPAVVLEKRKEGA
ncbi:acetyltransferase [Pseudalkalibacillus sp. SCS-8]|uniref:acetyltransferase n=1 Tax=Pseudalkalibacillus nanhaiensis TaxID=3115291 RepID=UPI0032DBDEE6